MLLSFNFLWHSEAAWRHFVNIGSGNGLARKSLAKTNADLFDTDINSFV